MVSYWPLNAFFLRLSQKMGHLDVQTKSFLAQRGRGGREVLLTQGLGFESERYEGQVAFPEARSDKLVTQRVD